MAVLVDRIPGEGKANRKKLTFEDNNEVRYAKIEYADDPIEAGVPYNLLNVQDTARSAFEHGYLVGDTISSMRDNMSSKWAVMNGASFTKEQYPDLADILGIDLTVLSKWKTETPTGVNYGIKYVNGIWFLLGRYGALIYRIGDSGQWISKYTPSTYLVDATYGNGYWVLSDNKGNIYYTDDIVNTNWTTNYIAGVATGVSNVRYGNGYWVAVCTNGNILYKANIPSGSWTSRAIGAGSLNGMDYANGYFSTVSDTGKIAYATDPTGSWTIVSLVGSPLSFIKFINNKWIIGVANSTSTLYYIDGLYPIGIWTSLRINNASTHNLLEIEYVKPYWIINADKSYLYSSKDFLSTAWTSNPAPLSLFHFTSSGTSLCTCSEVSSGQVKSKTYDLPIKTGADYQYIRVLP